MKPQPGIIFVVLLLHGIQVPGTTGSKSDSSDCITEEDLNSQYFSKRVMTIVQTYREADVDCKVANGFFSYYDFTNRCENCSTYCTSPLPDMQKRCIEKCEPFSIYQLMSTRIMALVNRIKDLEAMTSQNQNNINSLYLWLVVLTCIGVALVLAFPIGLLVFYYFFLKHRFAPHHSQVPPISDNMMTQIIAQPVSQRDDDDNGYNTL